MMPPRGDGLDFTPILTHYLFLFTSLLSVIAWFTSFISQAIVSSKFGHNAVGVLWFAIFLQLFLILGVLNTLASDSIAMNRFQISVFGAVAIVFAVNGANFVFQPTSSEEAMGAGWLITAIVDILWVLYFTSEEDSLMLFIFNSFGTGGLTPPSRRRRRGTSTHNMGSPGNGYTVPYGSGGVGPATYDTKMPGNGSFHGDNVEPANRSTAGSMRSPQSNTAASLRGERESAVGSPMMGAGNAGIGAGGGQASPNEDKAPGYEGVTAVSYKAKALYNYSGSSDDPTEISFAKGEILDIIDRQGKWWQAKKEDGTVGIAPSNYLQIV